MDKLTLFWFRRDLRLDDNTGLYQALKASKKVLPLFIFDTGILEKLENKYDARVTFIHRYVSRLKEELEKKGSSLEVWQGEPLEVFRKLCDRYEIEAVYTNRDYEPQAMRRDSNVAEFLKSRSILFRTFKDQCVFEAKEVVKSNGEPYTVYTPYMKAWKKQLNKEPLATDQAETAWKRLKKTMPLKMPSLKEIGFRETNIDIPVPEVKEEVLTHYHERRDFPALKGTSGLSVHLRFGTISIRQLVKKALKINEVWLNELIWREFFMMILANFPQVVHSSFKPQYDRINWRNDPAGFAAWCEGRTGYPIVDAGMRELNATGFMHNRLRMITASFLVKHLLVDWRWGEAYFAEKLLDFELSSNNGGWQWAAGTGCDAAPYFRIFNPTLQTKKFDPQQQYIKKWVPEFEELTYPAPIVDHKMARERVLKTYREALS